MVGKNLNVTKKMHFSYNLTFSHKQNHSGIGIILKYISDIDIFHISLSGNDKILPNGC